MAKPTSGYLIVRRFDYAHEVEQRFRKNVLALDPGDIEKRYVGLECEPWPNDIAPASLGEYPSLAPENERLALQRLYAANKASDPYLEFLHVTICRAGADDKPTPPLGFEFCGYDVGYLLSKYTNYSALFNEVLFGQYEQLLAFAGRLNRSLLLPTSEEARFVVKVRKDLLQNGADLETAEECSVATVCRLQYESC